MLSLVQIRNKVKDDVRRLSLVEEIKIFKITLVLASSRHKNDTEKKAIFILPSPHQISCKGASALSFF